MYILTVSIVHPRSRFGVRRPGLEAYRSYPQHEQRHVVDHVDPKRLSSHGRPGQLSSRSITFHRIVGRGLVGYILGEVTEGASSAKVVSLRSHFTLRSRIFPYPHTHGAHTLTCTAPKVFAQDVTTVNTIVVTIFTMISSSVSDSQSGMIPAAPSTSTQPIAARNVPGEERGEGIHDGLHLPHARRVMEWRSGWRWQWRWNGGTKVGSDNVQMKPIS